MQPVSELAARVLQSPSLTVGYRLALLDGNNNTTADLSLYSAGGTVARDCLATIHGSCNLNLSLALPWGASRVQPSMVLSSVAGTVTFPLGVYVLTTPTRDVGESPETYAVTGYDLLYLLNQPIGDSWSVGAGAGYLDAVTALVTAAGLPASLVRLDPSAQAATLPANRVWPLSSGSVPTFLGVINDLLAAVNYRGLWADWDGFLRSQPLVVPTQRPSEWSFDTGRTSGLMGVSRSFDRDLFASPNWWRFVANNWASAPIDGDGEVTIVNQSDGPSSIDSQGLRTAVRFVDAADQATLAQIATQQVASDRQVTASLKLSTAPFPAAWHFDRYTVSDPTLGPPLEVEGQSWLLPLDGSDMTHTWSVVNP